MSKDLWLEEYEAIGEDFVGGMCDETATLSRLKGLGMFPDDIDDHIDVLKAEIAEASPMNEHATWYHVKSWRIEPERVQVVRSTNQSVWYCYFDRTGKAAERRAARHSTDSHYFPSFSEAKEHVVTEARQRLERTKSALDSARNKLRDAEALKEPPHE